MKALILAAGIGKRLKVSLPKILLRIGNRSLLERHYDNLLSLGVKKIGIVVGYKSQYLIKCIKEIDKKKKIKIIKNPKYKLGSIVSLVSASSFFYERGELILMDGDVLYDKKILKKLIDTKKKYDGYIISVKKYGLFVNFDNGLAEGLVHKKSLPKDHYIYNDQKETLNGKYYNNFFQIGTKLSLTIKDTDVFNGKISLNFLTIL